MRQRPTLDECVQRLDCNYPDVAAHFREVFDEHRLAATVHDLRPHIKMTTAYRIANEIRAKLGLAK